jgi:hypothetical protein
MHERLFLECKLREKQAIWSLWADTAKKARKENKTPVVAIKEKGRQGEIYCIHGDDLETVLTELLLAKGTQPESDGNQET